MTADHVTDTSAIAQPLASVQELADFLRAQEQRRQDALAEARHLRHVIDAAATRLDAMVAGQRASRAELQAVIADLRSALGPADEDVAL